MNLNGFLSMTGNVSGKLGSDLVVEVEANPSGVATEPLIKLRVGDVIYGIPTGGGGGGTSDYNLLANKPKINNIILQDELSLHSLGIQKEITFSGEATEYLNGEGYFSTPPVYIPINYSTTEQKTGRKWIDGKDTYIRVFNTDTITESGQTLGNIPDIDAMINQMGCFKRLNQWYNCDGRTESPSYNNYYAKIDILSTGAVIFAFGGYNANEFQNVHVIIEYTKITD